MSDCAVNVGEHYQWCEDKKTVGNDCMKYPC